MILYRKRIGKRTQIMERNFYLWLFSLLLPCLTCFVAGAQEDKVFLTTNTAVGGEVALALNEDAVMGNALQFFRDGVNAIANPSVLRDGEDENETPASFTLIMDESSNRFSNVGWQLEIILAKKGRGTPWIDWNDDGQRQEDETLNYSTSAGKIPLIRKTSSKQLKIHADLEMLSCPANSITEVQMKGASMLKNFFCYDNLISQIDLSGAPNLEMLAIYECGLTELDLSHTPLLKNLDCGGNKITEIDLSSAIKLTSLNVSENELSELNVSSLTELDALTCYGNSLSKLDLKQNKKLTFLDITGNDGISPPDLSNNLLLHTYYFSDLGWSNFGSIEGLEKLRVVSCDLNNLSETEANRLVEVLPNIPQGEDNGVIWVVDTEDIDGKEEHNHFSTTAITKLRDKRWLALDFKGHKNDGNNPYDGIQSNALQSIGSTNPSVYPSPATEWIEVSRVEPGTEIVLYNLSGNIALRCIAEAVPTRVSVAELPSGIYYVQAGDWVQTLIIAR